MDKYIKGTTWVVEQQLIVWLTFAVVSNLDTPTLDVAPTATFLNHLATTHVQNELNHILLIRTLSTDSES